MEKTKCYFLFSGYCAVATASDILQRHHIENRIVKAPIYLKGGCSFAVLVDYGYADISTRILEQEKMKIERRELV